MLLPTPPDLPLLDRQEAQVAIIKAHQQALEQATTLLRQMVETAGQVLSSEQLAAWSTYLYWRGDPEINLGWLALATVGSPDYQSLKGHFFPIATGIDCALCHALFTDSYVQQSRMARRASFTLGQHPFRGIGLLTIGI